MINNKTQELSEADIEKGLSLASESIRHRHPRILHNPGDEFNQVINFILRDSYMQPHMHPGKEKIEEIHLIKGNMAVIYFNEKGDICKITKLEQEGIDYVRVPAYTWHTYVMISNFVITYETMMGVYEPATWKMMAPWAPKEASSHSKDYLDDLRRRLSV